MEDLRALSQDLHLMTSVWGKNKAQRREIIETKATSPGINTVQKIIF